MLSSPSFRPSAMPDLPAGTSRCSDRRPWVLIDTKCHTGDRNNATTAEGVTSERRDIKVSFELADPPGVSRCFVHCPGLRKSHLNGEPLIVSAADAFVLHFVPFTGNSKHGELMNDFFVYRAGPGTPSLCLLPKPYPRDFRYMLAGIVPLGDGVSKDYAVVIPVSQYINDASSKKYILHVYRSDSLAWGTKVARIAKDTETDHFKVMRHEGTRVIFAGEGSLGWVDLWWGILLCNVLDNDPVIRLIQWPVPIPRDLLSEFGLDFDLISPRSSRDVALSNGVIRFVELKFCECSCTRNKKGVIGQGWTATTWSREICSMNWHQRFTVKADNVPITESSYPRQVPKVLEGKRLTWDEVINGGPTLSLCDDDVVYIMAKLSVHHPIAWVLAINTREGTLEAVAQCSAERMLFIEPTYVPCALSDYLSVTPGEGIGCGEGMRKKMSQSVD